MANLKNFDLPKVESKEKEIPIQKAAGIWAARIRKEITEIKIDKLIPYKNQVRKDFADLSGMIASIEEVGISQPLTVIPDVEKDGFFQIVSGERRWRSAKQLGWKSVPCNIIEEKNADKISIIENLQRKDLTPLEKGEAFSLFIDQGISERKLSEILEENRKDINICLRLFNAPEWVRNPISAHKIVSKADILLLLQKAQKGQYHFEATLLRVIKNTRFSVDQGRKKNVLRIIFDEAKQSIAISRTNKNLKNINIDKKKEIIKQIELELNALKKEWCV